MIVIFHTVFLFSRYVYSVVSLSTLARFSRRGKRNEIDITDRKLYLVESETDFEEGHGPKFFPQLYVQRYSTVKRVLEDEKWKGKIKKVVDFGCAEFGFFQYLKSLKGCQEILEVDIDEELLNRHSCRVTPLNGDYLNQRNEPLTVYVLQGSVAYPDNCLVGCDAVVCIELIEHLYPDVLEDLPFTIFGFIKPLVAVFTTPNEEFNILFHEFSGFRHPDHKFEWTRSQFRCWAYNLVSRYPDYSVSFHGIGHALPANENLGGCSQMAVFEKCVLHNISEEIENIKPQVEDVIQHYKILRKCEFPFFVDTRSDRTKIREQAEYYIHFFSTCDDLFVDDRPQIPLTSLLEFVAKWTSSTDDLADILRESGWELVRHHSGGLAVLYSENKVTSEEEEEEENCFNLSCAKEGNQVEGMEDWQIHNNSSYLDNCADENWDCDDVERNYVDTGVNWLDEEGEPHELHIPNSKSLSMLRLWTLLDNKDTLLTPIFERGIRRCKSLPNIPSAWGPMTRNNSATYITCTQPENKFYSEQVANSSPQNTFHIMTKNSFSILENDQSSSVQSKSLFWSVDSPKISDCKSGNLFVSDKVTETQSDSSLREKTLNHNSNNHFQADIGPYVNKNPGNKLCLNLQLEGQNTSILEATRKLDGPSDSPIACSFSLDEPNDRQADSGYPNSASAQDMDLDLTPEQVDELFTENDVMTDQPPNEHLDSVSISSRDSDSFSEPQIEPLQLPLPVIAPQPDLLFEEDMNVENGDVANNNRDGEGNNALAVPQMLNEVEGNDNAGGGGVILHENFDLIPLIAAAEDLDNDNEIELNVVEPFPPWLLNLLGLAIGGREQGNFEVIDHSSDDDSDNNLDPVDEGLGEDDNLDSCSSVSDPCAGDIGLSLNAREECADPQTK